ncbi:MAG: 3-dehydroquinate synthase [Verrucomicrobiales bacterium]|nr:3-dehydroquinate synthase [Verrucomicrobiales bacterium]
MDTIERDIVVTWRHQVHFTHGVFHPENTLLRDVILASGDHAPHKVFVVLDEALARFGVDEAIGAFFTKHSDVLTLVRSPMIMEGGERVKNSYFHVSEIHSHIDRFHIDRHNCLICVGGGAILDMVGLAATTAHRGIRHIRIPTTTLSQDDSGVGVKNGINAFGKKNFIGSFCPPYAVINDFDLLETLPDRDKRGGFVEAVKVACIRDAEFFAALEKDMDALARFEPEAMHRLIHRCAELHLNHIATSGDPFEMGSARPLDFGHWAAHKLEQISEYKIRHGEAVAIGIALDVIYSVKMKFLSVESGERILNLLGGLGFELFASELTYTNSSGQLLVLEGLDEFREHLGGELTITLLREIGEGFEIHEMDTQTVLASLMELEKRFRPAAKGS